MARKVKKKPEDVPPPVVRAEPAEVHHVVEAQVFVTRNSVQRAVRCPACGSPKAARNGGSPATVAYFKCLREGCTDDRGGQTTFKLPAV